MRLVAVDMLASGVWLLSSVWCGHGVPSMLPFHAGSSAACGASCSVSSAAGCRRDAESNTSPSKQSLLLYISSFISTIVSTINSWFICGY